MSDDLEQEILKFQSWAIGTGTYSITASKAAGRAIKFLSRHFDVYIPTNDDVIKFVYFQKNQGRKNKTIENELRALYHFQRMLGNSIEVPKLKRSQRSEPYVPSIDEMRRVDKYVDGLADPRKKAFYRALFDLLRYTGARIGEVSSLDIGDVLDEGIYLKAEKNEANRLINLPRDVIKNIREYIDTFRSRTDQRALFTGPRGRASPDALRKDVRDMGRAAGVPKLHSHAFRHFVATTLLNEGIDLKGVQQHLGHLSVRSTEAYAHPDKAKLSEKNAEALRRFFNEIKMENFSEGTLRAETFLRGEGDLHDFSVSFRGGN